MAVEYAVNVVRLVFGLLLALFSRSFPGELFQHVDSKDLHQTISEMRIVETPLHSVRSVAQDGKWVFKLARHDFLLLRTAGDKWYKAEKHGPSSGQAGIHFYAVTGPGVGVIRFRSSISVDFSLGQALDILTNHKLHYNLFEENCWKYAHSRAESILKSCIEIESDDNVRSGLKKELENLMDARRRMPNEVVDIVQTWNVLWVFRVFFTGVGFRFWLGVGKNALIYEVMAFCSSLLSRRAGNPMAYNMKWMATILLHFNCLFFFGYCVCSFLCPTDMEFGTYGRKKHSETPFLRAAVSGRRDLAFNHLDVIEFQLSKNSAVLDRLLIHSMTTFDEESGHSSFTIFLSFARVSWRLQDGLFLHDRQERMRYVGASFAPGRK